MNERDYSEAMKAFCLQLPKENDAFKFVQQQVKENKITPQDLLQMICDNHNLIGYQYVRQCVNEGLLDKQELTQKGFDPRFIEMLYEEPEDVLPNVGNIKKIDYDTIEVYFWGIPISGKTCALGSIITAARKGRGPVRSMSVEKCQGLLYSQKLTQIFNTYDGYCMLPARTPVSTNFAIKTVMTDQNGEEHSVTLIDMAGELFCANAWEENGDEGKKTVDHDKAIKDFKEILVNNRSENPKYHFFIIEYNNSSRRYKDYEQEIYLEAGLRYLKDNDVLKANDKVFVIVTKTDLIPSNEDKQTYLINFLTARYKNFFSELKKYCKNNKINGGQLPPPIAFSIGEVCFQNLCKIEPKHAHLILDKLISQPKKKGWVF